MGVTLNCLLFKLACYKAKVNFSTTKLFELIVDKIIEACYKLTRTMGVDLVVMNLFNQHTFFKIKPANKLIGHGRQKLRHKIGLVRNAG